MYLHECFPKPLSHPVSDLIWILLEKRTPPLFLSYQTAFHPLPKLSMKSRISEKKVIPQISLIETRDRSWNCLKGNWHSTPVMMIILRNHEMKIWLNIIQINSGLWQQKEWILRIVMNLQMKGVYWIMIRKEPKADCS